MLYPPGKIHKEKDQLQKEMEMDNCIKLNIGGQVYATLVSTLTKDPQSKLAAMFSGRYSVKKEAEDGSYFIDHDGSYFIDRDGTHFRYILNYLRDGGFEDGTQSLLPSDSDTRTELLREAEYYQLSGLVALLKRD